MTSQGKSEAHVDRDGVVTIRDPRAKWIVVLAALASGVVILVALVAMMVLRRQAPGHAPPSDLAASDGAHAASPAGAAAAPATAQPRRAIRAVHMSRAAEPARDQPAAAGNDEQKRPELHARDVIPALVAAGEKEGIAAFPPPGTDPLKEGIEVPEDYELPPGYVRHYQVTDDGRPVAAILMFSPDYEFVDERGQPVRLPENRIVPPELAPPGLPIRMVELPEQESAR